MAKRVTKAPDKIIFSANTKTEITESGKTKLVVTTSGKIDTHITVTGNVSDIATGIKKLLQDFNFLNDF